MSRYPIETSAEERRWIIRLTWRSGATAIRTQIVQCRGAHRAEGLAVGGSQFGTCSGHDIGHSVLWGGALVVVVVSGQDQRDLLRSEQRPPSVSHRQVGPVIAGGVGGVVHRDDCPRLRWNRLSQCLA